MTRRWMGVLLALSLAAFAGCSVEESDDGAASYRAAIPPAETVTAAEPQATAAARTAAMVGAPAYYPRLGVEVATSVNGVVTGLFDVLREVVSWPSSYLDPVNQFAVWGPYPNGDDAGYIMVVIQKDPVDVVGYEYLYQFWRVPEGWDGSYEAATKVIVGLSNPNAPEGPNGIFFFDFDADAAFPGNLLPAYTLGGFAAAYAQVPVLPAIEGDVGGLLTLVVAAFRDFDPKENVAQEDINVDYLYGHFVMDDTAATAVDFLDFQTATNFNGTAGAGLDETLDVRMAFLNSGMGRAEVTITGGDLNGVTLDGIECWDDALDRQFLYMTDGNAFDGEGSLDNADPIFRNTLDELHIPSLAGFNAENPDVLPLLSDLATYGLAGWPQPE